jgi:hypothetical protein
MPAYSTLRTFVLAVQTGRTNIVNVLERICAESPADSPEVLAIQAPGSAQPLPEVIKAAFRSKGMTEPEVQHIERWPADQKERVRAEIVRAIQAGEALAFSWELFGGESPDAEFRPREGGGRLIAFRSPRSAVRLSRMNYGDISVEEV